MQLQYTEETFWVVCKKTIVHAGILFHVIGGPPSNRMRPTSAVHGLPNKTGPEPMRLTYVTVKDSSARGTGHDEEELKSGVQSRQTDSTTRHNGDKGRQTGQHGSPVRGGAVCATPGASLLLLLLLLSLLLSLSLPKVNLTKNVQILDYQAKPKGITSRSTL